MKTLLVKPYNLSDHIQPSLGLGYLASSVRKNHETEILDCIKERIKPQHFGAVLDEKKPDIAGIQCYTYDLYNVKEMLASCKKRGIKTVIGGPHPSAAPREAMEFFGSDLDYLFRGEAETGFARLLDRLSGGEERDLADIAGLAWRKGGHLAVNEKYFTEDLDTLGMPAWDLIKPQEYPEAQHGAFFKKFPIAPIMTTRGCPYLCTFCAGRVTSGSKLRKRSVKAVLDEIKTLYSDFGIREFHVVDDNFTLDKAFAKDFLRSLKKLNLDISWAVPNGIRMDTLDDEMLSLMKETGLYLISLGIESGTDRMLKIMKKNLSTQKVRHAIRLIRKHDIDIAGFFILGFPGETKENIEETIRFSLELDLVRANFFTYLPFPGTESFDKLKVDGKLGKVDLHRFYFMNATFTPEGMDKGTLKGLQRKAFFKFFLRPRIFIYNLTRIRSPRHLRYLLGRFFRWVLLK